MATRQTCCIWPSSPNILILELSVPFTPWPRKSFAGNAELGEQVVSSGTRHGSVGRGVSPWRRRTLGLLRRPSTSPKMMRRGRAELDVMADIAQPAGLAFHLIGEFLQRLGHGKVLAHVHVGHAHLDVARRGAYRQSRPTLVRRGPRRIIDTRSAEVGSPNLVGLRSLADGEHGHEALAPVGAGDVAGARRRQCAEAPAYLAPSTASITPVTSSTP